MTITAIASLYLLSVLGVEGDENSMVRIIGVMGVSSIGITGAINITMLIRTRNEQSKKGDEEINKQRSVRGLSSTELEEEMFMGALI